MEIKAEEGFRVTSILLFDRAPKY